MKHLLIAVAIFLSAFLANSQTKSRKAATIAPASADSLKMRVVKREPTKGGENLIYTGKRGGKYTIGADGKKRYLKK